MKSKYAPHKKLEYFYKMQLAIELTGRNPEAINKMMDRNKMSFAEVIKYYLEK